MGSRGSETQAIPIRVALFALFLCLIWGGLAPALKIALTGVPPLGTAALRFLLAWMAVTLWCRAHKIALVPRRREWLPLCVLGVLFTIQIATLNIGANRTSGSHTAVFLNAYPLFVALFSHLFLKGDRLTALKALGLVGAFLGVCVIFSEQWEVGLTGTLGGDLAVLLSGLLLGCMIVYTKYLIDTIDLHKIIVGEMTIGVPLFFLFAGLAEGFHYHLTPPVALAVAYQGIAVGAFGFVAWTRLLVRWPASRLSSFSFSTPIFGILLSALLLSEGISLRLGVGTGLVGAGVYLAQRGSGK